MKRRILPVLLVLVLLCAVCISVSAHDVPDLSRTGTIHITMRHGDAIIPGGTLTIYRVGMIHEDNGNFGYTLTEAFVGSNVSLENIQSATLAADLANYAQAQALEGETKQIDENAQVTFTDLELGLYLFVQYEAASGYNLANPFLVSVPAVVDGQYIYEVDGSPKLDPVTVKPEEPAPTDPTTPPDPTLPLTGQLNWPIPLLAVAGLLLLTAGCILNRGKKRT